MQLVGAGCSLVNTTYFDASERPLLFLPSGYSNLIYHFLIPHVSASFPLNYAIAATISSSDAVHNFIGMETSGRDVASLGLDPQSEWVVQIKNFY